jgi:hypothetical protein
VNDILDTINGSAFNTYDLTTSIGPVTGLSDSNAGTGSTYGTSKGLLAFNNMSLNSTFAATTAAAAVPEPSSLVLLGAAAIAGLLMLRRGRLL